jgi:fimbrial chaperone protein/chaperone protein EcpD
MRSTKIGVLLVSVVLVMASLGAQASVVISGTRIIYPLADGEQTVRLTNDGEEASLVQIWIDDGDIKANPNTAKAPFLVSPPISRIDPGKGQSIRLIYTGESVSRNAESVYYFNVLEVPPKPGAEMVAEQFLQLAFRTRIKLFIRPEGLEGVADEAAEKITWKVQRRDEEWEVVASNPTPYHVTIIKAELMSTESTPIARDNGGGMISPFETIPFRMKALTRDPGSWATLEYRFINDHGGVASGETAAAR